ncbi:hypothetical protein MMC28_007368 [Mycoblastus sanguinarius]|nr:hypothetical protein [Mycoblastus sanguinarius]
MASSQDEASPLQEYILTPDQTRYIVKERYLQELLDQKFGQGIDFKISTKSQRWRYWAPKELTADEVKDWISELDARVARENAQRAVTANVGTPISPDAAVGGRVMMQPTGSGTGRSRYLSHQEFNLTAGDEAANTKSRAQLIIVKLNICRDAPGSRSTIIQLRIFEIMNNVLHSNNVPLSPLPSRTSDPPELAQWREYPACIRNCNAITTHTSSLSAQMSALSPGLFSEDINVHIIDFENRKGPPACTADIYEKAADVERVLLQQDAVLPRIRILSLHSAKSPLPLKISETLMRKILTRYQVDPNFLPVLYSFGDVPHLAESGSSNASSQTIDDGSRNLSYQTRYSEKNHRAADSPWSIRQTGVYHHHSSSKEFDLFIFLHPLSDSVLERQLLAFGGQQLRPSDLSSICNNPYRLHILPYTMYLHNWRWYFRYLGNEFQKKNDQVMTLDLQRTAAVILNFDKVQGLRNLEDAVLSLSAYCKGSLRVIETMQKIPEADFQGVWSLESYVAQLVGYIENLSVLTSRIGNTINLFAYALDLKNQDTAANTNDHVSKLAEASTRDTAAVKWITYLTLFYLPGSFIATLYGMNLFAFDQATRRFVIAKDFWIYIVTWIPLTLLTFLGYGLLVLRHKPPQENGGPWWGKSGPKYLKGP